jgi:hypothetical protein
MKRIWEMVHVIDDYYDGPRAGIADFHGISHSFHCLNWNTPDCDPDCDLFELRKSTESHDKPIIMRGRFRVRIPIPDLPPGTLRPMEVCWEPVKEE